MRASNTPVPPPSGTITFLFTDIEQSTQRWERNRDAMQTALRIHDALLREAIAESGGHVFKTVGDAFCAAFDKPEAAASAAIAAQRRLSAADFSAVGGLRVRMAINTGTADERDGDYFGPPVNRVARLLSIGHGGQILLSGVTAGLVRANLPPEASIVARGQHALKDLTGLEEVSQLVAPGLERDFAPLHSLRPAPFLVPQALRTQYFTGREGILTLVRVQLQERRRVALSGLGGVGKTQMALQYAMRHREEYPGGVFWVDAASATGLTSGFVGIADALDLVPAGSSDQQRSVQAVVTWLEATGNWLLIPDNLDDPRDIAAFLPVGECGHVLITARRPVLAEIGIPRALEVGVLDTDEAVHFLRSRSGRDAGEDAILAELVTELGNLPLALEQAAAYIAETNASVATYLNAFRKRRVALLEKGASLLAHETVGATWAQNFEAVAEASTAAADLLRIAALLAPEAIPFELLGDGASELGPAVAAALAEPDDLAVAETLQPLARYSLVRVDPQARSFSMHRLVQEIVRTSLSEQEFRTYVERTVRALDLVVPQETGVANWPRYERFVAHVAAIAARVESSGIHSEASAQLSYRTGEYLLKRGRYPEAQALLKSCVANMKRARGANHPAVAMAMNQLAVAHWYLGNFEGAQPLVERALAIREQALGPNDLAVALSLNTLAVLHSRRGNFAQAEQLYTRVLTIRERALGRDHPELATILGNLGNDLVSRGKYAEAQALLQRALTICERHFAPDDPLVASSLANLAEALCATADFTRAQRMVDRALEIQERVLGPSHPDLGFALNIQASIALRTGRLSDAETLLRRSVEIRERALGAEHADLAASLTGLGRVFTQRGRLDEADSVLGRALAIREREYAVDLRETLIALAELRAAQGATHASVQLYERALTIFQSAESGHPMIAELRAAIAALRDVPGPESGGPA